MKYVNSRHDISITNLFQVPCTKAA